jgi:hypothetical protein
MSDEKYKVEITDFGREGDLKKGYGYSIYLNEEGHKSFEHIICIYKFDSHILFAEGNKEENNFPLGIESKNNIEKAEKRAYKYAKHIANEFWTYLGLPKEKTEIIDKTRTSKSLVEKLE